MTTITSILLEEMGTILRNPASIEARKMVEDTVSPLIVAYAWRKYSFILTSKDVRDMLWEGPGLWASPDEYVEYMQQVSCGDCVPDTINGTLPRTLRVFSDVEMEHVEESSRVGHDLEYGLTTRDSEGLWIEPLPVYRTDCDQDEVSLGLYCPPTFEDGAAPPTYTDLEPNVVERNEASVIKTVVMAEGVLEAPVALKIEAKLEIVTSPVADETTKPVGIRTRLGAELSNVRQKLVREMKAFSCREGPG